MVENQTPNNEEENKRYNEPTPIGKIINDMGFGQKERFTLASIHFADEIIKNLTAYVSIAEAFETKNKETSALMMEIEDVCDEETKLLAKYKIFIEETRLLMESHKALAIVKEKNLAKIIDQNSFAIQDILKALETKFDILSKKLENIVEKFPDEGDRRIYTDKIISFSALFRQIHEDITDTCCAQQELIK